MKNLLLLAFLCLSFIACKAPQYSIGMTEQSFLKYNNVSAVKQTEDISIYKKVNYPFGAPAVVKFFYFRNGKLVQMDQGERSVDYNVKISH